MYYVYEITTYSSARWLVVSFKTFKEALAFLRKYNHDAVIIDDSGNTVATRFDGKIEVLSNG